MSTDTKIKKGTLIGGIQVVSSELHIIQQLIEREQLKHGLSYDQTTMK